MWIGAAMIEMEPITLISVGHQKTQKRVMSLTVFLKVSWVKHRLNKGQKSYNEHFFSFWAKDCLFLIV